MCIRDRDQLPDWLWKWRVTINTEKSEAICFTRKSIFRCKSFCFEGRLIAWRETVKYLGVQPDRRQFFNTHLETLDKSRGNIYLMSQQTVSTHECNHLSCVSQVCADLCNSRIAVTSVNYRQEYTGNISIENPPFTVGISLVLLEIM